VTLKSGSLTSASAGNQIVSFGFVQNGTNWFYNLQPNNPTAALVQVAPPAKQINLNGSSISVTSGATIDESGGGDLFAGEFVPGTGGSKNIFAGTNVYAVIPGYSGITPYDPGVASAEAVAPVEPIIGSTVLRCLNPHARLRRSPFW